MPKLSVAFLAPLAAGAVLLCACSTTATAPAASTLPGSWRLDPAASDDASSKISLAIRVAQEKVRQNQRRFGMDVGPDGNRRTPPGAAAGGAPGDDSGDESYDIPLDPYGGPGRLGPDFHGLRQRLLQALQPPSRLKIEVSDMTVRLTPDDIPPRDYHTDETFSRFDEYGTSKIDASWKGTVFILRARYSGGGQRLERYDAAGATLTLTSDFTDPVVGKIEVRSTYRRP